MLQPSYSLVLRCLGTGITGEVPLLLLFFRCMVITRGLLLISFYYTLLISTLNCTGGCYGYDDSITLIALKFEQ